MTQRRWRRKRLTRKRRTRESKRRMRMMMTAGVEGCSTLTTWKRRPRRRRKRLRPRPARRSGAKPSARCAGCSSGRARPWSAAPPQRRRRGNRARGAGTLCRGGPSGKRLASAATTSWRPSTTRSSSQSSWRVPSGLRCWSAGRRAMPRWSTSTRPLTTPGWRRSCGPSGGWPGVVWAPQPRGAAASSRGRPALRTSKPCSTSLQATISTPSTR
mmetsp:Transcript_150551/g.419552  ORF Transcript_150551/g.419552 Transcript_150551/m.419552 type:complete len:214 (-) Transcript_150551:1372-2013(-)